MRKTKYFIATKIGVNLQISKEGLAFIKKADPELYKLIKKTRKRRGIK
jgi:hypothetical protein